MATKRPRNQFTPKLNLSTLQSAEIEHAKPRPGPQSPQLEKDAKRAMAHTADWQPLCEGGGGYRQEDRRREIYMGADSNSA
ncbi:hypothetical protein RRF57_009126 [Xylaria bambusicola]|uniref:Uncharacterized protein n=1 Tax=Xylaria bambusicola TaxID=326684 RepID=A0AAN7Z8S4_9PEZI